MNIFLENEYNEFIPAVYKSVIDSVVELAQNQNINIFLIGGVVRDLILKNPFKDVDITVEGDAVKFGKILEANIDCKIVSTQENLRTVKVVFANGTEIDFASTREERYIASGVLPVAYNFGCSLEKDVKRRDFTINTLAIALCGSNKYRLIDYYDGYNDIKNKTIRILHNASFVDDPSRIVRALKFMRRFDFTIEPNSKKLMSECLNIEDKMYPLERIKNELFQYFSINKKDIYKTLIDYEVYKFFNEKPVLAFDENNIEVSDKSFLLFSLLILNSDYENEKYNLTVKEKKILKEVKVLINEKINPEDNYKIYCKYNEKSKLALEIYQVISNDATLTKYMEKLRFQNIEVSGNDLINLGFKPSKSFSNIFKQLQKEKLEGNIRKKEDEIKYIKENIKKTE